MNEFIAAETLRADIAAGRSPVIVDVRPPAEFAAGRLPGAVNIPIDDLARRMAEIPRDRAVVVY